MNILIAGASGFIGTTLVRTLLQEKQYNIRTLSRNPKKLKQKISSEVECYKWNPNRKQIDNNALKDCDVVINLAGENIAASRWTEKRKKILINSRVNSTKLLVDNMNNIRNRFPKFISTSAVGIYGDRDDEILDENSAPGEGFLADLCKTWEKEALSYSKSCVIRVGMVLGRSGGALPKMLVPFKLGLGGRLGSGNQFMSWIHIDDLIRVIIYLANSPTSKGIYNTTAPVPIINKYFTKVLGQTLHRPNIIPIPSIVLKTLLGDLSEVLLQGQRVIPKRLKDEGFTFCHDNINEALNSICK